MTSREASRLGLSRYQSQFDPFPAALADVHRPAAIFIQPEEVRILPRVGWNVLPGKQPVVARRDAVEMKTAGCIGARRIVQVEAAAARWIRNENRRSAGKWRL